MNGAALWSALSVEPEDTGLDEDPEVLWGQYFRRQRLLSQIVRGDMHPDDLLDCMLDDGLSPDDYLESLDDALKDVA